MAVSRVRRAVRIGSCICAAAFVALGSGATTHAARFPFSPKLSSHPAAAPAVVVADVDPRRETIKVVDSRGQLAEFSEGGIVTIHLAAADQASSVRLHVPLAAPEQLVPLSDGAVAVAVPFTADATGPSTGDEGLGDQADTTSAPPTLDLGGPADTDPADDPNGPDDDPTSYVSPGPEGAPAGDVLVAQEVDLMPQDLVPVAVFLIPSVRDANGDSVPVTFQSIIRLLSRLRR